MLKKILNSRYFLAAIGLIYLIYYIWFRFIRERLPKDIPFILTFLSFVTIIYIIGVYIYILLRLIKPKTPSPSIMKILALLSKLLVPWVMLDNLVKENYYIKPYYEQCLRKILNLFDYNTILKNRKKFYIIYFILPRGVLLFIFCLDLFYFHQLKYFYTFIPLGAIPILVNYFIYSLKNYIDGIFRYLELCYLVRIISEDSDDKHYYMDIEDLRMLYGEGYLDLLLDPKNFAEYQAIAIRYQYTLYEYDCWIIDSFERQYFEAHGLNTVPSTEQAKILRKNLREKFFELLPIAINGTIILDTIPNTFKFSLIIKLHMAIISIYIICWTYILLVSIHSLSIIEILKIFISKYNNPFS